ncbi:(2Fe-2S)-binding protein [Streptomyces sp. URMC 129]|uniref:(2Fe-2S)-binding protein n=1 Tax=Streptomyces sp. URMC 129 TaxID=3423407 RepID=UPI003F1C3104
MKNANGRQRPRTVRVVVDGTPRAAWEGQTVTAVLVAAGVWALRRNPVTGRLRGPFCGMGVCMECEIVIDGRPDTRSCLVHVTDGMDVRTRTDRQPPDRDQDPGPDQDPDAGSGPRSGSGGDPCLNGLPRPTR